MVVSASKQRSDDFSTFTLRLINEMPILQHLRPREDQRNSKISFDVGPAQAAHMPSVKSVGIFGQLAGSRANHIIADDIEVPNNSMTEDMREKLLHAVGEFESIMIPEKGRITYLGTPQTEESIYVKLRDNNGYDCRIWPARYPTLEKAESYRGSLAPTIQNTIERLEHMINKPTDPERFGNDELMEREAAMGRTAFTLQFMLDTTLSDQARYPLKLKDLVVMNLNHEKAPAQVQYASGPEQHVKDLKNIGFNGDKWYRPMWMSDEWLPYEGRVMSIDPSGRGSDELGWSVVFHLHGNLFLMDAGGLQGGYETETLETLSKIAKTWRVNEIVIESNFGDGMFKNLLQPVLSRTGCGAGITEERANIQKEKRICDTLEPVMGSHRLIINKSLIERDIKWCETNPKFSLFYQMTRITRDRGALRHDDRLDSLAQAVKYYLESMGRDERTAADSYRESLKEADLKAFMDNCFIRHCNGIDTKRPKERLWVTL